MKRHTELSTTVGLTVASVSPAVVNSSYEAIVFGFTDGSELVLVGGGYDGCGDYLRVEPEGTFIKKTP